MEQWAHKPRKFIDVRPRQFQDDEFITGVQNIQGEHKFAILGRLSKPNLMDARNCRMVNSGMRFLKKTKLGGLL